jgi:hypothetical protein
MALWRKDCFNYVNKHNATGHIDLAGGCFITAGNLLLAINFRLSFLHILCYMQWIFEA